MSMEKYMGYLLAHLCKTDQMNLTANYKLLKKSQRVYIISIPRLKSM